uniref:Uncharacterized protein n=1 Tax=Varanus komodoensis TaxID=61221 RepID=A0A8D2L6V3_VARKO
MEEMGSLSSQLMLLCAGFSLLYMLMKTIQFYYRRRALLKAFEKFPGPPSHWLYGNVHQITSHREELDIMLNWAEQFPYGFPRWFGGFITSLVVTHPDYAKTVFCRGGKCIPLRINY